MQVTTSNAAIVAALFRQLSADARYTMRSPAALIKGTDITEAAMMDAVAQIGLRLRRRIDDGAMLVERPNTVEEAQAIVAKALLVADGLQAPFEVDFSAANEVAPAVDILGDIERGLSRPASATDEDEEDGDR